MSETSQSRLINNLWNCKHVYRLRLPIEQRAFIHRDVIVKVIRYLECIQDVLFINERPELAITKKRCPPATIRHPEMNNKRSDL